MGKIEINSLKVNVLCGLFYDMVIGLYFFNQPIIKLENVLNTLHKFVLLHPRVFFQRYGARPHLGLGVIRSLEGRVSWSTDWTGPPRSTDVLPLDFFFLVM